MDKPHLPDTSDWPQETAVWFEAWRGSALTDGWEPVQWQYMFETATVHALVYGAQQFDRFGELDKRERYMGLTFEPVEQAPQERKVTPFDIIAGKYADGAERKPGAEVPRSA